MTTDKEFYWLSTRRTRLRLFHCLDACCIGGFLFEGPPHLTNATGYYYSKPCYHYYSICASVCLNSGSYNFCANIHEEMYLPADFNWLVVACMVGFGSVGYLLLITFL